MIKIPIANRTAGELLLGLEPEGDTVALRPGQTLTVVVEPTTSIEITVEDGLLSIGVMSEKQVWDADRRLR